MALRLVMMVVVALHAAAAWSGMGGLRSESSRPAPSVAMVDACGGSCCCGGDVCPCAAPTRPDERPQPAPMPAPRKRPDLPKLAVGADRLVVATGVDHGRALAPPFAGRDGRPERRGSRRVQQVQCVWLT